MRIDPIDTFFDVENQAVIIQNLEDKPEGIAVVILHCLAGH
jgi:hypothetical protein